MLPCDVTYCTFWILLQVCSHGSQVTALSSHKRSAENVTVPEPADHHVGDELHVCYQPLFTHNTLAAKTAAPRNRRRGWLTCGACASGTDLVIRSGAFWDTVDDILNKRRTWLGGPGTNIACDVTDMSGIAPLPNERLHNIKTWDMRIGDSKSETHAPHALKNTSYLRPWFAPAVGLVVHSESLLSQLLPLKMLPSLQPQIHP